MQGSTAMIDSSERRGVEAPTEVAGIHLPTHDGDAVWFTNFRMTLKVTADDTGGAYGLVEGLATPGSGPPLHIHTREDEAFWVLEGRLRVRCGDRTFNAGPGSFTFLPRGIPHTFVVEGDELARIISICSPGGFERFFVDAGQPAREDGVPPAGPVDVAALARIGARYGLQFVGPPLTPSQTASAGS
jgi:mannose-6-phosphate isomerase-like protein (cupin superfamily)